MQIETHTDDMLAKELERFHDADEQLEEIFFTEEELLEALSTPGAPTKRERDDVEDIDDEEDDDDGDLEQMKKRGRSVYRSLNFFSTVDPKAANLLNEHFDYKQRASAAAREGTPFDRLTPESVERMGDDVFLNTYVRFIGMGSSYLETGKIPEN